MKPLSHMAVAAALAAGWVAQATATPELVVLVRHAEKAAEPPADPALSPAGEARARALAQALAGLKVNAIVTTQFQRTRDTAAPLAQALSPQPQVVATRRGDLAGHVRAVADAVLAHSGVVLVVGHSNTVTAVLAALGGPSLQDLCETSFGHVFLVTAAGSRWAQFSYGAPSEPPQAGCL